MSLMPLATSCSSSTANDPQTDRPLAPVRRSVANGALAVRPTGPPSVRTDGILPASASLATVHTSSDAWPRAEVLDLQTRALISVTISAVLGTLEPLRGQLRIALHNGVSPEQIVEAFIQIEAYAGAARAFDSYRIAREVFAEISAATP
jgi:alkylhydroperoxidase/carboxymuconolactone decarboxylase family protein YurZ